MNSSEYKQAMEHFEPSPFLRARVAAAVQEGSPRVRPLRRTVMVAVAAALAVGCALSIAAGLPAQVYHFISGGSLTVNPGTNTAYYDRLYMADPVEVDGDGRVWLTAGGQRLDITDKVDEDTPYLYEYTDSETGQKGYLLIGGDHDNLGWMEWYQMDGDWFWHAENCLNNAASFSVGGVGAGDATIVVDIPDSEAGGPGPVSSSAVEYQAEGDSSMDGAAPYEINFRPWVKAGIEQLAEMGIKPYEPHMDVG